MAGDHIVLVTYRKMKMVLLQVKMANLFIFTDLMRAVRTLSGTLKMTVDTINSLGILGGKPYDEATTNLLIVLYKTFTMIHGLLKQKN